MLTSIRNLAPVLALLAFASVASATPTHFSAGHRRTPGAHPRTLLLPSQRARLQDRAGRHPYTLLLSRIHAQAARSNDPTNHAISPAQSTARTARAAALLFYLDRSPGAGGKAAPFPDAKARQAMGNKAAAYLLAMKTSSRAKGAMGYILDIHTAQELHMWADTLDLLLGADIDVLPGAKRALAVQNVADLAADFYSDFESYPNYLLTRALINNHRTKSASALGLAALVLNGEVFSAKVADGRYHPARWLDFAMRYVDMCSRDILTDADFGNQEGPGYLAYGGIDLFGFLWAWHNYSGAASYPVDWSPAAVPHYRFHVSGRYTVPDLWSAPWLERQVRWLVRLMLPDGTLPGFDDNSPGGRFFFGALVRPGVASAPLFRWAWRMTGYTSSGSVDQAPLLLATFDDTVQEATPLAAGEALSLAMPHAGQVVFRSGWGSQQTQAMVLCEHGKAAGWAQNRWGDFIDGAAGHEHPDPGAFSLVAGGERLIIDSGYMGWDDHDLVNKPENHNILLVDGQGPQLYRLVIPETQVKAGKVSLKRPEQEGGWAPALDGMAYLTASDTVTPGVHLAEVLTSYKVNVPATEIRRRVTFLASRFLVVQDRALTAYNGPGLSLQRKAYTFQIHGNGGGTSGGEFSATEHGGLWIRPGARVRAAVSSSAPLVLGTRLGIHDPGDRKVHTHTVLDATATARQGEPVSFTALMAPEESAATGGAVKISVCRPGPCLSWTAGALWCQAWSGSPRQVTGATGGAALLEKAGAGAYCRDAATVSGMFDLSATGTGGPLISARFQLDGAGNAANYTVRIHRAAGAASQASLDLPAVAGQVPSGACSYASSRSEGADRWQVTTPGRATVTTASLMRRPLAGIHLPAAAPGEPATVPLGKQLTLSGAGSCSGDRGARLTYAWRLVARPELSTLTIPLDQTSRAQVTLLPDLPGVYRLELRVSAGGQTDSAEQTIEVEGELPWPAADAGATDAGAGSPDLAAPGPDTRPAAAHAAGGSGCALSGATVAPPTWLLLALLLLLTWCGRQRF